MCNLHELADYVSCTVLPIGVAYSGSYTLALTNASTGNVFVLNITGLACLRNFLYGSTDRVIVHVG